MFLTKIIRPAIVGLLVVASTAIAQTSDDYLATFSGGESITDSDFGKYIDRRIDLKPTTRNVAGVKAALEEMILTRLLAREGAILNIPKFANKDEKYNDVYAHAVYQKLVPACRAPEGRDEERAYYDKTPEAFTMPASIRLKRVILPSAEKIESEAAGLWLFSQAQLIAAGKIQFDEVVKKADQIYQIDPQGDLGWVALDEDNQIINALASANDGDLVGPITEGDFVYLFQIAGKKPAAILPWEQAATFSGKRAVSYCRQKEHKKLRDQLFEKYDVKIINKNIEKMFRPN